MKVCGCPNHTNRTYVIATENGTLTWKESARAESQSEFVGVDGSRCGWFTVGLRSDSDECELKAFRCFKDLLAHYATAKLILVDIPIGLPDGPDGRLCDNQARRKLGHPRRTSVFPTPTRQTAQMVHSGANYSSACDNEKVITNKKISKQAFAISGKIHEVDYCLIEKECDSHPVVREVHPEVCFWALKGKPMTNRKGAQSGVKERINVLQKQYLKPEAQEIFDVACSKFFRKCVAKDDVLDALVASVTAREGWRNNLHTLPKDPTEGQQQIIHGDGVLATIMFASDTPNCGASKSPC